MFDVNDLVPAAILDAAALEAARLWQPYGIVVEAGRSTTVDARLQIATAIRKVLDSGAIRWKRAIGQRHSGEAK